MARRSEYPRGGLARTGRISSYIGGPSINCKLGPARPIAGTRKLALGGQDSGRRIDPAVLVHAPVVQAPLGRLICAKCLGLSQWLGCLGAEPDISLLPLPAAARQQQDDSAAPDYALRSLHRIPTSHSGCEATHGQLPSFAQAAGAPSIERDIERHRVMVRAVTVGAVAYTDRPDLGTGQQIIEQDDRHEAAGRPRGAQCRVATQVRLECQ